MLNQVIIIALGVVFGIVLLVALVFIVGAISNARDEAFIRKYEQEEAERMRRDGYVWFMGGWVKKREHDD